MFAVFRHQLLVLFNIGLHLFFFVARQLRAAFAQERPKENEKLCLGDVGVGWKEVDKRLDGSRFVSLVKQRLHLSAEWGVLRAVVQRRKSLPLLEWRLFAGILPSKVKNWFLGCWRSLLFAVKIPVPRRDLLTYESQRALRYELK